MSLELFTGVIHKYHINMSSSVKTKEAFAGQLLNARLNDTPFAWRRLSKEDLKTRKSLT